MRWTVADSLVADHDRRADPAAGGAAVGGAAPQSSRARAHRGRRPTTFTRRRSAAAARGPTKLIDPGLPPRRRLVRGQGLGAAPAPARHARPARGRRSALLVAATGAGKTLAGFLPTICDLAERPLDGLHTLYVSPLKALGVDVQRNLHAPIAEMGLAIRVETRSGDTPSDRKARQRARPPHVLLTTPESLSLLLVLSRQRPPVRRPRHHHPRRNPCLRAGEARRPAQPCACRGCRRSARTSPGRAQRHRQRPRRLSQLARARRGHRRGRPRIGDPGAEPDLSILIPDGRIPWGGHSGRHAAREVMKLIEQHRTTLVFCNTRSLAELIFQELWTANDKALPIGIHHGSLALEARRKVEAAMGAGGCGRWSAPPASTSASTGAMSTRRARWARPRVSSRLLQRIGRANHRLDEPSQGMIVPGNRFEYLEARAALDAVEAREPTPNLPPGNARRPRPVHPRRRLRRPVREANCSRSPLRCAFRGPERRGLAPVSIISRPAVIRCAPMTSSCPARGQRDRCGRRRPLTVIVPPLRVNSPVAGLR